MATVSNSFDALQGPMISSSSKKKRNKKKNQKASSDAPESTDTMVLPSAAELESLVEAAVSPIDRLELWEQWNNVLDKEANRIRTYVDSDGKPASLRTALVSCRALEKLAEGCVDTPVTHDQREGLETLIARVFVSVDGQILQDLVEALVKVGSISKGKNPEIVIAAKRALRDVMTAVRKSDAGSGSGSTWKTRSHTRPEAQPAVRRSGRRDKKTELHEAMEGVKSHQSAIDEIDEEGAAFGGVSLSRSISDFQVTLSLGSQVDEPPGPKKGKKKGKATSPMLESLRQEDASYAAEEAHLNEEIANLEVRLKGLKSQLASVRVSRAQIQSRKEAIMVKSPNGGQFNGAMVSVPPEQQMEAIGYLEGVASQLQAAAGLSDDQKKAASFSYVESLEKFFALAMSRQEDMMNTVRFLKDAIFRRLEQEEKMKEISTISLSKEVLRTQQASKHELEVQLKDEIFDAGDLMIKVNRIESDLIQRLDFLNRYLDPYRVKSLQTSVQKIKETHAQIKQVAEEKREIVHKQPDAAEEPESRKKINTKEIIREEEMKARQEIAAKMAPKPRSTSSRGGEPMTPEEKPVVVPDSPPKAAPVSPVYHPPMMYYPHGGEAVDPRYIRPMFMAPPPYAQHPAMHHPPPRMADPEVYQPMMQYRPPVNPAGPVQRPPTNYFEGDRRQVASGSKRPVWKKIGEQSEVDSGQIDLPTPGEARKQGKL